ncbi:MAG: SDR family NAD(P)-dependent oxidoreductase [Anaerolineae bacterium]|nr:SDR family NAD(P)-dependent oxidoreductase [Anaerolineae bacterium]
MQTDKVIIVTGASSGIGEATARLFAQRGWAVVLAARSVDKLQRIAEEIRGGGRVLVVPTDVTVQEEVTALVQRAYAHFGRIDVLLNNAGGGISGTVESLDLAQLEYIFKLNVLAPVAALQAVAPIMKQQNDGIIVNVSSLIEGIPVPYMSGYGASKAALGYLSDAAAIELDGFHIAVLKVLPGLTETNFDTHVLAADQTPALGELFEKVSLLDTVPPETVAEAIWNAVASRRRQSHVTAQGRFLGRATRLAPEMTNRLLKFAIKRYAPVAGPPRAASVGQDALKAGLALAGVLAGVSAGYLLYRRARRCHS